MLDGWLEALLAGRLRTKSAHPFLHIGYRLGEFAVETQAVERSCALAHFGGAAPAVPGCSLELVSGKIGKAEAGIGAAERFQYVVQASRRFGGKQGLDRDRLEAFDEEAADHLDRRRSSWQRPDDL